MPTYTLCSKVIKASAKDDEYLLGILFRLLSETKYKISLDKQNKILAIYYKVAENSFEIKNWLDILSKQSSRVSRNLSWIDCVFNGDENENEVFIIVCKSTIDKNLICDKKEDYPADIGVTLFDKDEVMEELRSDHYNINADNGSIVAVGKSKVKKSKSLL